MNKKEFLKNLEKELTKKSYHDIKSVLEFYDELIEDKIESGKSEKKIIKEIGEIDAIIKELSVKGKIDIAKEKPTISNGFKALFAVLGVLSLPLLIPLGIVILALVFTLFMLLFSLILVMASGVLAGTALAFGLMIQLFQYHLPITSFIFGMGIALIILGTFTYLLKASIVLPKKMLVVCIKELDKIMNRKRSV